MTLMKLDWQTIAVAIIVACAFLYVARRGLARLRSFTAKGGGSACATGCGKCGDEVTPSKPTNAPVQISRARTAARRD